MFCNKYHSKYFINLAIKIRVVSMLRVISLLTLYGPLWIIMDHILFKGHNAAYNDFSILIPENNQFKLHFKESLLIKRDKRSSKETFTPIP